MEVLKEVEGLIFYLFISRLFLGVIFLFSLILYYVVFGPNIIDVFFIVAGIVGGLVVDVVAFVVVVAVAVGIEFDECSYFVDGIVAHVAHVAVDIVGYFEPLLLAGLRVGILFVGDNLKLFVESC